VGSSNLPRPTNLRRAASADTPLLLRMPWAGAGIRGHSSVGRAPALQAGGRRFDPVWLHQRDAVRHGQSNETKASKRNCSSVENNSAPVIESSGLVRARDI